MGIFSSIGRVLGGAVTGFVTGGPLGAVSGAVRGAVGGGSRAPAPSVPMAMPGGMPTFTAPVTRTPGLIGQIQRLAPGGATGYQVQYGGGFRPKGRRMNFGNARAAGRAIRRIKGARDLLKRIESQLPRVKVKSASGGKRCGCK